MRESFVTWDKSGTTIHIPPLPTGTTALFWVAGLVLALLLLGYLLKFWPNVRDGVVKRLKRSRIPVPWGIAVAIALGLFGLGFLCLAGFAILRFFQALLNPESHEAVRNIGFALAAIIGLPFLIWRSVVAQSMATTAQQGLITDRINKAVEGLGAQKTVRAQKKSSSGVPQFQLDQGGNPDVRLPIINELTEPNLEVRIGSIYALERIAQDSDRDHIRIMEILCAYIRENAPARDAKNPDFDDWEFCHEFENNNERVEYEKLYKKRFGMHFHASGKDAGELGQWAFELPELSTDIGAALNVIGRRLQRQIDLENTAKMRGGAVGYQLDLRRTNLQRAEIFGLNFQNAILFEARLEGANLIETCFKGANLRGARINAVFAQKANFDEANLQDASFQRAKLGEASFSGAQMWLTKMEVASLKDASFFQASFFRVSFEDARLDGADLRFGAETQTVNLWVLSIRGAAFKSSDLNNTDVKLAGLQDAYGDGSVILPEDWTAGEGNLAHWSTDIVDEKTFERNWRAHQAKIGYTPSAD